MDFGDSDFLFVEDEDLFQKIDSDLDLAFAISLQEELQEEATQEAIKTFVPTAPSSESLSKPLGIVDPQWELIDPNPDIHSLFVQFNDQFFFSKLGGVEVRWSPRMTLCAGVCCYQGRGGLCSVRLSLPLLKLRPRRDLVETLLHEMIHAYLFVTANNRDHDAHGPEFCSHMARINKESGTRITIYHSFHDEVDFQRKHWWKCDGPCQNRRPFYGVVKRAMNRAPGPNDNWWAQHMSTCGGTFSKVKEPENFKPKAQKRKSIQETKVQKTSANIKNFFQSQASESFLNPSSSAKRKREVGGVNMVTSIFEKEANVISVSNISSDTSSSASQNYPVPFSGQGFTLGSSTSQHPSLLSKIRKELGRPASRERQLSTSPNNGKSSITLNVNNMDTEKNCKKLRGTLSHLTVSPTSSNSEKGRFKQSSLDKFVKSPPKGLEKENELSDTFYVKQELKSDSTRVACPVCSNFYPDLEINSHLDQCLLSAV